MGMRVIEVENLAKEFNGRTVLRGITFHVRRGEVFGLLGPNGSGKTTTMRIILGLLKPTSGKVRVLGGSLADDAKLRSRVGVVLEGDGLFTRLSAYENLDFYARIYGLRDGVERRERIRELLELVGLYDVRNMKVGYFSKGMRRRLALARALIHYPEVLLLDEPTSGLDPEAKAMVRDLVIKLSRGDGVTVLYTSHDLNEVEKVCSRIAVLVKGRIIVQGVLNDLLEECSGQVMEVCFTSSDDASKAFEYLRMLDYVPECRMYGKTVHLVTLGNTRRLLRDLVEMNLGVEEVRRVRRTLEEIYLELVRR